MIESVPTSRLGHDVLWDESYCRIAATDGTQCEVENSLTDPRLTKHAAREAVHVIAASYCARPTVNRSGNCVFRTP